MDTGEQVSLNPQPLPPRTIGLTAVVAIAVSALLAAWGTFGDEDSTTGDYVFVLIIIGVLAAKQLGLTQTQLSPISGQWLRSSTNTSRAGR